jgi:oligoribonuclease NrnB/cAMP/cGMP phosphodiesterase (DHH superfamily)
MKKSSIQTPKQKIVVIYHGKCPDGFGGAWAAWKKFGAKAAYFPAFDRAAPPVVLKNKIVYIIDYTYDAPIIKKLLKDNIRVTAIDHHVSQLDAIKLTEKYSYDVNHSGAVLAWQYFHPGEKMPMLLRYIEDRDIWKWKVPHAREMLMLVDLTPFDFKAWSRLAKDIDNPHMHATYLKKGALLELHYRSLYEKLLPNAELVTFAGHKVYALNCPYYFADDLGHELALKTKSFSVLWSESGGRIRCSLRSTGKIDVSKIAKKYGGGGHKAASGFSFPVGKATPWKLLPVVSGKK